MKHFLAGASMLPLLAMAGAVYAADAPSNEIIVTGTRQVGVKAADSAAPIQLVGAVALKRVGQQDLKSALSQSVPSFNAEGYGADTAALTLTAQLRGLNPNDTLILVDGKRRHTTSNLHVDTSPFAGAAPADLSFIPIGAIDHVEILTDGAAAQYGSDAVAGVVNIILKKNSSGGAISGTLGQYEEGDGKTGSWSLNKGFSLGSKGFLNVTAEETFHGFSTQGTYDRRLYNPDGTPKVVGNTKYNPVDANGVLGATNFPVVNRIYGDPTYNLYNGFANAGYNLTDDVEAYAFGSIGRRVAQGYENYRLPSRVSNAAGTVFPFPNGFEPREKSNETDYSITGGLKGVAAGWNFDLSASYGADKNDIFTVNSANASLYADTGFTPHSFYDGQFRTSQLTGNLDLSHDFSVGMATPLSVAFGGELRKDTFGIAQGDAASIYKEGGQSYPGFQPTDAGSHSRNNAAVYVDFAVNPVKPLHIDLAGRYEHYSDFGNTVSGKATVRYDFSPALAIRGTISNGFRAPTLAEEYYSATNVAPTFAVVQLPPNSAAAAVAGFSHLRPEKSTNYSIGFVAHPTPGLSLTADFYDIEIRDRILQSATLLGLSSGLFKTLGTSIVSQGVLDAIKAHGNVLDPTVSYVGIQIYSNAANTRTRGVEVTANYASDFGDMGHVDWSAGFDYNQNTITKLNPLPIQVTNVLAGQTALLQPTNLTTFSTGTPKTKLILGAFWSKDKWSVNLKETIYGPSSEILAPNGAGTGPNARTATVTTAAITDIDVSYKITSAIRIEGGANNVFNKRPPVIPLVADSKYGGLKPADGNNVFNEPLQFSPYGINGGFYYGKITVSF